MPASRRTNWEKVFDMFWQADASTSRRFGGTGLGMTVARDLTRLMGGQIAVRSQVGEGTTFSVRLPLLPERGGSLDVKPPKLDGQRILIFETNSNSMEAHLDASLELGMEAVPVSSLHGLLLLQEPHFDLILICDSLDGLPLQDLLERLDTLFPERMPILFAGYRGRTTGLPPRITEVILKPFIADQLAEARHRSAGTVTFLQPLPSTMAHTPTAKNKVELTAASGYCWPRTTVSRPRCWRPC